MIYIMLINADNTSARRMCEDAEGGEFESMNSFITEVGGPPAVCLYTLSEFMDLYNNEEVNEAGTFMGYVDIDEQFKDKE